MIVRRVVGGSMLPGLRPGQIVVGVQVNKGLAPGMVVVVRHQGLEKIKRVSEVHKARGVYVVGDNLIESSDSRMFGWLPASSVVARVVWPRV